MFTNIASCDLYIIPMFDSQFLHVFYTWSLVLTSANLIIFKCNVSGYASFLLLYPYSFTVGIPTLKDDAF